MPDPVLQYRNAKLHWNSWDLVAPSQSLATPTFLYSREILNARFRLFQETFPKARVHFAMKSNHWAPLLKTLAELGSHVDVVSSGEIRKALECGFRPEQILFSGVGKTLEELQYAVEKDIFQINVEGEDELAKLISIGKPVRIGLRWTPGLDVKTHKYIRTSHDDTKFGLSQEDILRILPTIQAHSFLRFQGLSLHLGSQILDLRDFRQAFTDYREFVESLPLKSVNVDLGGGLGVDYHSADLEADAARLQDYQKIVHETWSSSPCQILLEPGRFLVARAGGLVTRVQAIKKTKMKKIIVVDAGMNNLIRPVLYEAHHEIFPLVERLGPSEVVDVVGPICESSDFLALERKLPPLAVGDILFIADCGAYGSSMSSNYNLREPADEIFLEDLIGAPTRG